MRSVEIRKIDKDCLVHINNRTQRSSRPLTSQFDQIPMLNFFRKNTISDGEMAKISRQYTNQNEEIQVGEDASNLLDLGYNSPDDLKETIYGKDKLVMVMGMDCYTEYPPPFQTICAPFEIPKNLKPWRT